MAAIASMNMPTRIRNRKTRTSTMVGPVLIAPRKPATCCGSPSIGEDPGGELRGRRDEQDRAGGARRLDDDAAAAPTGGSCGRG